MHTTPGPNVEVPGGPDVNLESYDLYVQNQVSWDIYPRCYYNLQNILYLFTNVFHLVSSTQDNVPLVSSITRDEL